MWLSCCVHYIITATIIANNVIVWWVMWFFRGIHTTKVLFHKHMFHCHQVFTQEIMKTSTRVGHICKYTLTYYILPVTMYLQPSHRANSILFLPVCVVGENGMPWLVSLCLLIGGLCFFVVIVPCYSSKDLYLLPSGRGSGISFNVLNMSAASFQALQTSQVGRPHVLMENI